MRGKNFYFRKGGKFCFLGKKNTVLLKYKKARRLPNFSTCGKAMLGFPVHGTQPKARYRDSIFSALIRVTPSAGRFRCAGRSDAGRLACQHLTTWAGCLSRRRRAGRHE
jgi:hypothetical protein